MNKMKNKDDHLRRLLISVLVLGLTLGAIPLQLSKANPEDPAALAAEAPMQTEEEEETAPTEEPAPTEVAPMLMAETPMLMSLPGPGVTVSGPGKPTEVRVRENSGPGWTLLPEGPGYVDAMGQDVIRPIEMVIRLSPDAICSGETPTLTGTNVKGEPLQPGDYSVTELKNDIGPYALPEGEIQEYPQEQPEQQGKMYWAVINNYGMTVDDFNRNDYEYVEWVLENITVSGVYLPGSEPVQSAPVKLPDPKVENELNRPGISSDTTLTPVSTLEQNGVSTTWVADREITALLDKAKQHENDTDDLDGEGLKEGVISIGSQEPEGKIREYKLVLMEEQFSRLAGANWDRLTVDSPAGRFSLSGEAIRETQQKKQGPVTFSIQPLDHQGRPGLDLTLKAGPKDVTLFDQPYGVRGFVPYVPQPGEDTNAIVIEYLHEDGEKELVTECFYDEEAGGVYFYSTHLSKFGITYRPAAFKDAGPKHWSNPYVTFLAARGIVNGTSGGFRPDDPATRGQFVTLLGRSLSAAKLPGSAMQVYRDVPVDSYAAKASNWVFFNNLDLHMTTNNRLRPNEAISRQDAAAFVGNAIAGSNLHLRSRGLDDRYTDLKSVSGYARTAVQRLTSAGILEMNSSHRFFPKQSMTRGEMAQIIANMITNL